MESIVERSWSDGSKAFIAQMVIKKARGGALMPVS